VIAVDTNVLVTAHRREPREHEDAAAACDQFPSPADFSLNVTTDRALASVPPLS
jgi:predicted nucleic acid-binding protein